VAQVEVNIYGEVVDFMFDPLAESVLNDEEQPGLEISRNVDTREITGYTALNMVVQYDRIMQGLKTRPIKGQFTVTSVDLYGRVTPIHDPAVTDVPFAEVVRWVYETYFVSAMAREHPLALAAVHEPGPDYVPVEEQNQGTKDLNSE
jgi:hypothetical protein